MVKDYFKYNDNFSLLIDYYDNPYVFYNTYYIFFDTLLFSINLLYDILLCEIATIPN